MKLETYEQVARLINSIRCAKHRIKNDKKFMNRDLKKLNELLKENGESTVTLEDISTKYPGPYAECYDDCCEEEEA